MNIICIAKNMTSTEIASWVQAVGSVAAILAAAGIAIWQSKKQHESALKLFRNEQAHIRMEAAKTLAVLARNCSKAVEYFISQLNSRDSVYEVASGEKYFDFGQLNYLSNYLDSIPLHNLPSTLVTNAMILNATYRQFKDKVESAIKNHRSMNSDHFHDLFNTFEKMSNSLNKTCVEIESKLKKMENQGP